jgi:hypothetical protein
VTGKRRRPGVSRAQAFLIHDHLGRRYFGRLTCVNSDFRHPIRPAVLHPARLSFQLNPPSSFISLQAQCLARCLQPVWPNCRPRCSRSAIRSKGRRTPLRSCATSTLHYPTPCCSLRSRSHACGAAWSQASSDSTASFTLTPRMQKRCPCALPFNSEAASRSHCAEQGIAADRSIRLSPCVYDNLFARGLV